MRFTNEIPTKHRTQARARARFGEAGRYGFSSGLRASGRQSVNISHETMERVAKEKLTHAIMGKIAYNRFGALDQVETIGQHLSTTA